VGLPYSFVCVYVRVLERGVYKRERVGCGAIGVEDDKGNEQTHGTQVDLESGLVSLKVSRNREP